MLQTGYRPRHRKRDRVGEWVTVGLLAASVIMVLILAIAVVGAVV